MKDLLPEIEAWRHAGNKVAVATVVKVEGSAPRPVGAAMAVSSAGDLTGSVIGGYSPDQRVLLQELCNKIVAARHHLTTPLLPG